VLEVARRISGVLGRDHRHRREYEQLRRRVRTLRRIMGGLRRVLERMDETGGLPGAGDAEPGEDGLPPPGPLLLPSLRRRRRHDGKGLLLGVNLGQELEFDPLPYEERLEFDAAGYRSLIADVRGHVRTLRTYLQRLGLTAVDEPAARRGRRLDIAQSRQAAVAPRPDILVFSRDEIHADAYVGVLVDRSASMEGESMARARRFAALLAESARGVRGLEGHVSAFDDDTFYRLGGFQRCAIAALEAGGGNNDAGGLLRAAELALLSRRRHRLLVMISDGMPTECTFDSLQGLVERLTRTYGILCAQVGVARIERVAFPQHVDLSVYPLEEAVARFGRLLISLTRGWR
jgi:nitric oxide reductase activation protein